MHRAGQTCTTCHADEGPGSPPFAFGGTVYDKRNSTIALPGVTVSMVDAKGVAVSRTSNEVGNFYVLRSEFDPTYPVHVTMSFGAESKEMKTRIGGDGGCARCHQLGGDLTHMPAVYLREE